MYDYDDKHTFSISIQKKSHPLERAQLSAGEGGINIYTNSIFIIHLPEYCIPISSLFGHTIPLSSPHSLVCLNIEENAIQMHYYTYFGSLWPFPFLHPLWGHPHINWNCVGVNYMEGNGRVQGYILGRGKLHILVISWCPLYIWSIPYNIGPLIS